MFEQAKAFIWKNARLLERRQFAYHFEGGSREGVVAVLRAYQNSDGGFGNALEPICAAQRASLCQFCMRSGCLVMLALMRRLRNRPVII